VTRLAAGVRDRSIEVDHLSTEITLGGVTHLPGLHVEILHFDVQLVERTVSAEREPSLGLLDLVSPGSSPAPNLGRSCRRLQARGRSSGRGRQECSATRCLETGSSAPRGMGSRGRYRHSYSDNVVIDLLSRLNTPVP
jgi:hypothetical protein